MHAAVLVAMPSNIEVCLNCSGQHHRCLYCSGQQHARESREIYADAPLQHQYTHHHHHYHQQPNKKKAFIFIFDSILRPIITTGDHTALSYPQRNQNCLKPHCHINISFIITHTSMSLSVNQAEAPSHIEVVCFGHGANPSRGQSRLLFCVRIPQRPCIRESMITDFPTVPCHVVIAVLTVITHQCYIIEW